HGRLRGSLVGSPDFKLPLNLTHGPPIFVEIALALTAPAQSFRILPLSQTLPEPPSDDHLEANAIQLDWEFGDAMLMTPFVWHREELNRSNADAATVFVQFSRPFIKPHADHVRAIDSATWAGLSFSSSVAVLPPILTRNM